MGSVSNASEVDSFRDYLEGPKAFYNQSDYLETTRQDFLKTTPLPVHYSWTTESKIKNIARKIFVFSALLVGVAGAFYFEKKRAKAASVIGAYTTIVTLLSPISFRLPIAATQPELLGLSENHADESRAKVPLEREWKYKRITLEVDGHKIDAVMMGKISTLTQGRWVLRSNNIDEFYEDTLSSDHLKHFLTTLNSNAILFNWPKVGATPGPLTRETMTKAYRVVLTFLEDQKQGMGAKELIGLNSIFGSAVQGDALKKHALKEDIKYVFVQLYTFSDIATAGSTLKIMKKLFNLDWDNVASSKKLKAPEIIVQAANVKTFEEIKDSSQIADTNLSAKASLAKALLDDPQCPKHNKVFIGVSKNADPEASNTFLAQEIEKLLHKQAYTTLR